MFTPRTGYSLDGTKKMQSHILLRERFRFRLRAFKSLISGKLAALYYSIRYFFFFIMLIYSIVQYRFFFFFFGADDASDISSSIIHVCVCASNLGQPNHAKTTIAFKRSLKRPARTARYPRRVLLTRRFIENRFSVHNSTSVDPWWIASF